MGQDSILVGSRRKHYLGKIILSLLLGYLMLLSDLFPNLVALKRTPPSYCVHDAVGQKFGQGPVGMACLWCPMSEASAGGSKGWRQQGQLDWGHVSGGTGMSKMAPSLMDLMCGLAWLKHLGAGQHYCLFPCDCSFSQHGNKFPRWNSPRVRIPKSLGKQ